MKKILAVAMVVTMIGMCVAPTPLYAKGLKEGTASFVVPGWGQVLNGEHETKEGKLKIGLMAALETGAIITTSVVGGVVGYPEIWSGIGIFIFNHVVSAVDAAANAKS